MAEHVVEFHPLAREEALAAYDWYADRDQAAAAAFQTELENARMAICRSPEIWMPYVLNTRRYLLKQFPVAIIYRVTHQRIEIIAVAHQRRRPRYWTNRTQDTN